MVFFFSFSHFNVLHEPAIELVLDKSCSVIHIVLTRQLTKLLYGSFMITFLMTPKRATKWIDLVEILYSSPYLSCDLIMLAD